MRRRIITEEFMLDNVKYYYQYNDWQQYYIFDDSIDREYCATLRLHCIPKT